MSEMAAQKVPIDRATWGRFVRAVKNFAVSEARGRAALLLGGLLALLLGINGLNVVNSYVGRDFMTAIERRDMHAFVRQALLYVGVFGLSTLAAVTYRFSEERLGLLWRQWLTKRLLDRYLEWRNYHRLRGREDVGNPDQRIADDTRTFVTMTLSFVLMVLNGVFTIVAFSGVLLSISPLLWGVALGYAVLGSFATVGLGRSLVRMNYDQADLDASLRAELVHVRENAESIAITNREPSLRARLHGRFDDVVENLTNIIRVNRNLGYFTTGYNYLIQIIPALLVGPLFIRGQVEFGVIPQSAMAFSHLLGAFSLVINQFQSISSYAAVLARLSVLAEVLEVPGEPQGASIRTGDASRAVAYENVSLRSPADGALLVAALTFAVPRDTRLLVVSSDEAARAALFLATAGMWTAGNGAIVRPPSERTMFVPARPYLGPGNLRDVLSAGLTSAPSDDAIRAATRDLGVEDVIARAGGLDTERDWANVLSLGEQKLVELARVALASPEIAFLYGIETTLGPAQATKALRALRARGIVYVTFSGSDALREEHERVLVLGGRGAPAAEHDTSVTSA
jgi:putative ATP-binding cassette transporter